MGKYKAYLGWIKVMTWVTIKGGQHNLSYLQVRAWSRVIFSLLRSGLFFSLNFFIKKNCEFFPQRKAK